MELLESFGLNQEHIFCSSLPDYGVPLREDIYDYLKAELTRTNSYVIYFLSSHYYESAACLNEMGAAWVLGQSYLSVLLPGFRFRQMKGAVNPRRVGIDLNAECTGGLNALKEELETLFGLNPMPINRWERYRGYFLEKVKTILSGECS